MRCGLLTEIIKIYSPITIVSKAGQVKKDYKEKKQTRARVIYNDGNRELQTERIIWTSIVTFEVYRYIAIEENDLIYYNDKKYRILSISEDKKQNKKTIKTELVNE